MMFEQRSEGKESESMQMCGRTIQAEKNSRCKGPGAGTCWGRGRGGRVLRE